MKTISIWGWSITLSWLAFIILAVFIKSIDILFNDFFVKNALIVAIVSGILILVFVSTGIIALRTLFSRGKHLFK